MHPAGRRPPPFVSDIATVANESCLSSEQHELVGVAHMLDEAFAERVDAASQICATDGWVHGNGMVLNSDRFREWGHTPAGAMGQISWTWDRTKGLPPPSDMPNHKSAMIHAVQLGQQLDDAEKMGMIEYYDRRTHGSTNTFAHNVIPLGARVKPSGSIRMLVDPSLPGVNDCMQTLPCPLPTIERIMQHVKPTSVLGKRDLLNGFFHIILAPDARRHMAFRHPVTGRLARWVVLPQGTKQSPSIFCAVSEAGAAIFNRILREQNIKAITIVYVDDYIIIGDTHEDMVRAFAVMDVEGERLGLVFNPDKDIGRDQALTNIEALGLVIDAPSQELRLPEDKRMRYTQELQAFMHTRTVGSTVPRKAVESLVGKLLYTSRVCRWGYLFVQELLDALYPLGQRAPVITYTEGALWDLQFWERVLVKGDSQWLGTRKYMLGTKACDVDPKNFATELFTDASTSYGAGGVLRGEIYSHMWPSHPDTEHIGTLELKALALSLEHWKHDLAQQTVLARMDNVQAVAAVNKGASRKLALRPILLDIALLGIEYGFELKAQYVKGELNPADAPSKGKAKNVSSDWTFTDFARFNNPPAEIDCCAAESGYNIQPGCTTWFSMARPVQQHVDSLVGKVCWANPPFDEIHTVLDAIVTAWQRDPFNTQATVLVPEWPTANWYRRYPRRKRPLFTLLHRYPEGSAIFHWKNSPAPAPPTKFPILILRLGGRDTS